MTTDLMMRLENWLDATTGLIVDQFAELSQAAAPLALSLGVIAATLLVLAIAAVFFIRLLRRRSGSVATTDQESSPGGAVSGLKRVGIATIGIFFFIIGGWAYQAPLSSAAIAPGVVSPEGSRRTIQHFEGGIIASIHVKDGDRVDAGDPLVTLQDTQALAAHAALAAQHRTLRAVEARLTAEQRDKERIDFPKDLADSDDTELQAVMNLQRELFASRRATRKGRKAVLEQQIAQFREEISGLETQIDSQEKQLAVIAEEAGDIAGLYKKRLVPKTQLLALRRARAEIEGERAGNRAGIARARQAIGETRAQILTFADQYQDEINAELADTRTRLATLASEMRATQDVLKRTVVSAPVSGVIVQLRFKTTGGVIGSGEPIMDIVPEDAELLVDARLSPLDIDDVTEGLSAQVVLSAYRQRNLPRLYGDVRYVSADRLVDEATGEPYFLARVAVDDKQLQGLTEKVKLAPGMPAEVFIATGEQTMFDYLIGPFLHSLRHSFRES